MGICVLDMVDHNGAVALCRFMYTKYGFTIPTLHDGGSNVHYREVATALWERLGQRQTGRFGGRSGAPGGLPTTVKPAEQKTVWCSLVRALFLVDEWPFWTGGDAYPTPLLGHFYEGMVRRLGQPLGPFVWLEATGGPRPLVSDLLPRPTMAVESSSSALRRNSLLTKAAASLAHVQLVPQVHVTLTRQQRLDQALMQAAHGVARCVTIACQGLQDQRNEPFSEDSLVAAYMLGHHFANIMCVPMQGCSDLLMRCTPFSPEVPDNHLGRVHAAVQVVDSV